MLFVRPGDKPLMCVYNNNMCVVQEWAKQYYAASTALQNREAQLDDVAEKIEKVSMIHIHVCVHGS